MSDELYKPDPDDDYQFTDNENAVVYKADKPNVVKSILSQRRLWLGLAILVLGIIVYKLSGIFSKQNKLPQEITSLPKIEQPAPESHPVAPVKVPAPAVEPVIQPNNNPFLDKRLADVEQHNKEDTARLSHLEGRLDNINADFSALRAQLGQLQSELKTVSSQMLGLERDLAKAQEAAKPKPVAKSKPVVSIEARRPQYHVQAVLPGRAWLVRDEDSTTLTVAVGDALPGYGTIVNINPTRASVITSTGYTIPYKPD